MSELFDYKKEMSQLRFTEEQKKALAEAAASAAGKTAKRRRPVFRTALIAAAVAAVLVVGAGAAGVLPSPAEIFAPLFGGSVAQTEVIDKIGHPIGAGDSDSGVTVTADAVMGDAYNVAMVYTFSRDDGQPFLPEGLEARALMVDSTSGLHRMNGGAQGIAYFFDADPEDNAVQYIECLSAVLPLDGGDTEQIAQGSASADFRNVEYWNQETEQYETLYGGHWRFRFEVGYEDTSIQLAREETFSQDGIDFTLHTISLSPLGLFVGYTADREPVWSNSGSGRMDHADEEESDRFMGNVKLLLTKTDGTVLEIEAGGSIIPENGVCQCTKSTVFDEIIPLEELESVSVGGVVYEIPHD